MTSEALRKLLVAAAAVSALLVASGCDTVAAAVGNNVHAVGTGAISSSSIPDQGLAVTLAGYDAILPIYTAVVPTLSKADVARGKVITDKFPAVRQAAVAAYKAGNAASLTTELTQLNTLYTQLKSLVPASAIPVGLK